MIREDTYKLKGLRNQLVQELKRKGITDERVLQAMNNVPRHYFVALGLEELCYKDQALPIAEQQTISQPYTVAYQTQHLSIQPYDKVLEIGTGSGYQSVILAAMGAIVYTVERISTLYESSKQLLSEFGLDIRCILGDGTLGWADAAPYHKIIVTAGAPSIPTTLIQQLAIGGKMIVPIGDAQVQKMTLIEKKDRENVIIKNLDDFRFVPLIGKEGWGEKK